MYKFNRPFLIAGDFNEIIFHEDMRGQDRVISSMRMFKRWIDQISLIEVTLEGGKFTWCMG